MVLIAVYYLFNGSIPLNKVNDTVDKPNIILGILKNNAPAPETFRLDASPPIATTVLKPTANARPPY
jgi:hypothetical protein